ncbi:hypothetical protein F5Y02DRAFT_392884 [Annulohypoxylon stygium]|nr:hypothetical protein F5Y02DRAFT_392884 [Annulohypoxylon stygium]
MDSDSLKFKVYRLRGCPGHLDRLGAAELLSRELGDIAPTDIAIKSLATNLDPWAITPTKVGTLMFHKTPTLIGEQDKKKEWKLSVVGFEDDLILDIHFWGMTPLNDVQPEKHEFDCIAISGLASHPFGSWQPKGEDKSFMWIRDELPRLVPELRASIYGYDTTLAGSNSFQSIQDLAMSLIDHIKSSGWILPSAKPLVFLAHSLGGIILKEVFSILANSGERNAHILNLFQGGIFFGVPSQGMHTSHLLTIVKSQTTEKMIQDLSKGSEYLLNLDNKFSGLSAVRNMRLHLAYETKTSPTIKKREDGSFERTGLEEILVCKESATRSLSSSHSLDIFPINKSHSNMVKFRKGAPTLRLVVNRLRVLLYRADDSRLNDIADVTTQRMRENPQLYDVMESANMMGRSGIDEPASSRPRKEAIENLKKSLEIPSQDDRFDTIEGNFEHTFEWVYDTKMTPLADWLRNQHGLFWIQGKPGSGKSTLMKFIANENRTWVRLHEFSSGATQMSVKFFFHNGGAMIQKTFEGLLRSVLHQIIQQFESSGVDFTHLIEPLIRFQSQKSQDAPWSHKVLRSGLHHLLQQDLWNLKIFFLFDALDEYEGRPESICHFLKDLMKTTADSRTHLKILFSSRPREEFTRQFKNVPSIQLEDYTRADLQIYCNEKLGLAGGEFSNVSTPIISKVVDRADGVFHRGDIIMNALEKEAPQENGSTNLANILEVIASNSLNVRVEVDSAKAFLSAPDPSTNHNKALAHRMIESSQRLLQHEVYIAWERERNSFLWIHGIPGSGKTLLSSTIIENLQNAHPNNVVYFYFDSTASNKQRYEDMLRSLIDQLGNKREDVRQYLISLYLSCDNGKRQPSLESLCTTVQSMIQGAGEIWIVIDALDECSSALNGYPSESLQWIQNSQRPQLNTHLLITSRPNEDVESVVMERITKPNMISLQSNILIDDIRRYIHKKVRGLTKWQSRPDLQIEIESSLVERANGRFLWVNCRLDELEQCLDYDSVLKVISFDNDVDINGDVGVDSASETLDSVRDNDSIFSLESKLSSISSAHQIEGVDVYVSEFSSLLFQDEIIKSVISSALLPGGIGFDRMKRNFRRLLGRCAKNLKAEPSNNYRENVAHFVKTCSSRITEELFENFSEGGKKLGLKSSPPQDASEKVKEFLVNTRGDDVLTGYSQDSGQGDDQGDDSDSDQESDLEADDEPPYLGSLIPIKQFITESVAYENLRRELHEFVHPSFRLKLRGLVDSWSQQSHDRHIDVARYGLRNLITELQDVNLRKIQFHEDEEANYLRRFVSYYQEVVERRSGECWDWWPLPPYLKALKKGEVRLRWECSCGEKRWTEVPRPFAERLQSIIHSLIHQPPPILPSYNSQSSQPTLNTQDNHGKSSGLRQGNHNVGGASTSNVVQPGASPQRPNDQNLNGDNRRIILMANRGRDFKIVQIRVEGDRNRTFFGELRKEYFRLRGFIRSWCSIWTYSHCDFYKARLFLDIGTHLQDSLNIQTISDVVQYLVPQT